MRSPKLTRDEWVLLLDIYLNRRPGSVAANDPSLLALSELLAKRHESPAGAAQAWRSPDGLRARMSVFRVLDPNVETPDTKRSRIGEDVWRSYASAPEALAAAAEAARSKIAERPTSPPQALKRSILADPPTTFSDPPSTFARPSQGPVPSFGEVEHVREDGETLVYLLELTGSVSALYGDEVRSGLTIIKVGRTNDVNRRVSQLNSGFPPRSGLAWRRVTEEKCETATAAHDLEQLLLDRLFKRGLTLGGEFALLPGNELEAFLSPPLHPAGVNGFA